MSYSKEQLSGELKRQCEIRNLSYKDVEYLVDFALEQQKQEIRKEIEELKKDVPYPHENELQTGRYTAFLDALYVIDSSTSKETTNPECTKCGLLKSTVDATCKQCLKGGTHEFKETTS